MSKMVQRQPSCHLFSLIKVSLFIALVKLAASHPPQVELPDRSVALITSALGLFPTRAIGPDSNYYTGFMGCSLRRASSVSVSNDTNYVPDGLRVIHAQRDTRQGASLRTIKPAQPANDFLLTYRWVIAQVDFHVYPPFGLPERHYYVRAPVLFRRICTSETRRKCLTLHKDFGVILTPLEESYSKGQLWVLATQPYPSAADPRAAEAAEQNFVNGEADDAEQEKEVPQ
ncbi:hypothetical protein B0H17DRAFT_1132908 [Mycena rosella]|uniref:Uncharacterized protein n=1 Tax=Mycena rosella TaxID=1033263 RepID=A0AAD7GL47_MYCRO|nr:hypothetical protein B0H17DRAFT_1132908 [Mycena rosella]